MAEQVYYGTWQQLANFEARGQRVAYDGTAQGASAEIPRADVGSDPLTAMSDLLSRIAADAYLPISTAQTGATMGAHLAPQSTPLEGWAGKVLGTWRVGPASLSPPNSIIPPAPEGAVDYEWQTSDGAVVGGRAVLHNLSAGGDVDDPVGGREGDWAVVLGAAPDSGSVPLSYSGATTLAMWGQGSAARNAVLDIGGYLDEGGSGLFQLLGRVESLSVTAFNADPIQSVGWSAGLTFNIRTDEQDFPNVIRVYYDVRPPLFRWVYDKPMAARYPRRCRRFPRGD